MYINQNFVHLYMARNLKPKFTEEELGMNPFIQSLTVRVCDFKTGRIIEDEEGIKDYEYAEREYDPHTKIYTTSIDREIINKLSPKAKDLYLFLIYSLNTGKDYFWFNRQRYMEELQIKSNTTVCNALNELSRYCIIYNVISVKDVYWINPAFLFAGNRIKKYKNNVKVISSMR